MLYRFIIDNYRSFGETTQFDMFPNPKRENMKEHVYMNNGVQTFEDGCTIWRKWCREIKPY